ncbi:MAG: MFS transporter [Rhizobiaceae bacterium]
MHRSILTVLPLLTGTLFMLVANGMQGMIMPLRGQWEGFSVTELGWLGTGWAAGFVIGCLTVPKIIAKVGHVRAFAVFAAINAIIALLSGLIVDPLPWLAMRCATGYVMAGSFMVLESWLNDKSTNETRGLIFGLYLMITYVGITLGQMSVAVGTFLGPTLFTITGIIYCLSLIPISLSTRSTPAPPAEVKLDLWAIWRNSPVAAVACFLIGIANGCFGTLGAVYGSQNGMSPGVVAAMMSAAVLAGALVQMPVGRFSDLTDRRYVLAGAALGAAIAGLLILVFRPQSSFVVFTLVSIYGALAYALYSVAVAHANDHASAGDFVKLSGGLLLLYGVGTIIGPMIGSKAMDLFGPAGLFAVTALAQGLIAAYAIIRSFKRAPVPIGLRALFRSTPSERALTPESVRLDPRSGDGDDMKPVS